MKNIQPAIADGRGLEPLKAFARALAREAFRADHGGQGHHDDDRDHVDTPNQLPRKR